VSMAMDQALVTKQNVWRVKIQMLLSVLAAAISLNHAKKVIKFHWLMISIFVYQKVQILPLLVQKIVLSRIPVMGN